MEWTPMLALMSRGAQASPPNDGSPQHGSNSIRKSVAVYVAGQLGRLELRSKMQNLAAPSLSAGIDVDWYFLLQDKVESTFSLSSSGFTGAVQREIVERKITHGGSKCYN